MANVDLPSSKNHPCVGFPTNPVLSPSSCQYRNQPWTSLRADRRALWRADLGVCCFAGQVNALRVEAIFALFRRHLETSCSQSCVICSRLRLRPVPQHCSLDFSVAFVSYAAHGNGIRRDYFYCSLHIFSIERESVALSLLNFSCPRRANSQRLMTFILF